MSGCKDPKRGQSSANESPVPDGRIVLLRRANEVAAFILKNQRAVRSRQTFIGITALMGKAHFRPEIMQYQEATYPAHHRSPFRPLRFSGQSILMDWAG